MAAHRPELYTIDSILAWYEQQPAVMYRIFAGQVPQKEYCRYQYLDEKNKDTGFENLRLALQSISQDKRNTNPYVIQAIESIKEVPHGKKTVEKIDAINIGFKLNDENYKAVPDAINGQPLQIISGNSTDNSATYMERMFAIMEKNNEALLLRLEAMDAKLNEAPDELEEYEETVKDKFMGAIGGIISQPEFQQKAAILLGGLIDKFFTTDTTQQVKNEW